ncbi:MAG: GNAT family N-acetyltransferase [Armatimonas sp.]
MPIYLETPRLILFSTPLAVVRTRLVQTDFSASVSLLSGTREIFFPAPWPGDALMFFPGIDEAGVEPDDWSGTLLEKSTNIAIGQLGTMGQPDANGSIEIGYGLNPDAWGKGYATEIVGAFTAWLLQQPNVKTVRADTAVGNLASQRVLQKNGFLICGEGENDEDGKLLCWAKS